MGFGQSVVYSEEVPGQEEPKGCTKVRRNPDYINGLWECPQPALKTMKEIILNSFKQFGEQNCLGKIILEKKEKQEAPQQAPKPPANPAEHSSDKQSTIPKPPKQLWMPKSLEYKTYSQVHKEIDALGAALIDLNLCPQIQEVKGLKIRFMGIFSKNRPEWSIVDFTCILYGFVVVPIYDTLGPQNIPYVLKHTQMETTCCSQDSANVLLKTTDLGNLKNIISFDKLSEDSVAGFKDKGIKVYYLNDLIQKGKGVVKEYANPKPEDILSFCYTSGTTGPPKGAMISHKNFASFCAVLKTNRDCDLSPGDHYLSYLPLAHVLERLSVFAMIYFGGTICSYSGDVQRINLDIALVRPHFFVSVPRLFNRMYDTIKGKFDQVTGIKKTLLDRAFAAKASNLHANGSFTHPIYDRLVFGPTRQAFGGRIKLMISGSAPLLPHVEDFIKIVSCAPLVQGYGQTQSTGASFVTNSADPVSGYVGGPTSNIEFKLEDVPEIGYKSTDVNDKGEKTPRGQICMRGPGVFIGYYKDEQKTKQTIDQQGWLHTGDIGMLNLQTGSLKIVDRKKNIFKLQQGEYVAAQKVEAVYQQCPYVSEIFLHGDSHQNFAVGIVVLNPDKINEFGETLEDVNKKENRQKVLGIMNALAKSKGLSGFEMAKNLYIDIEPFMKRGVVSTTMKLQRHEAKKYYEKQIKEMYDEGMLGGKKE